MSAFVGFRLNDTRDADIIKDLDKYKDTTARVKEVYRKVILMEQGNYNPPTVESPVLETKAPTPPTKTENVKTEKIVWSNFPKEPSVKSSENGAPISVKSKLLNNGF